MSRKRLIGNSYDVKCVEVGENICDNSIQFYTEMTTEAGGNLDVYFDRNINNKDSNTIIIGIPIISSNWQSLCKSAALLLY